MKRKVLLVIVCVILLVLVTSLYVAAQGPTITIYEPIDGITVQAPTITLRAAVESPEGHPLEHLEVRVNGFAVLWKDKGVDPVLPSEIYIENIQLEEGENQVAVIATNGLGSAGQAVTVTYTPLPVQIPSLYVLAIGVSDYERDELNLSYADLDAQGIVEAFYTQEGSMFGKVEARLLLNEEASRSNILNSLDWMLSEVTQRDLAVIFVSGHGVCHEVLGDYYFLPYDGAPENVTATAILWFEFERRLKALPGKTVLLMDTCHAGGVTGEGTKRAALNLEAIQDFATAGRGAMVMASSTGEEFSREDPAWGHGAFTKAILDGLTGGADYNGDGIIYTVELDTYVTTQVKELTGGAQHPTTETSTEYTAFPLFVLAGVTAGPTSTPIIATSKAPPTDTPIPPTDTPIPLTATPTETPTSTCVPNSAFVEDVTVPDNTVFEPGEEFEKAWRLKNTGSCPWDEGYKLVFVSGDQMGAPASQPVPATAPGETADVGVTMQTPRTDGAYKGVWQMQSPSDQLFGQEVTVVIVVQSAPGVGSTKINPVDGAEMVSVPAGEFIMGSSDDDSMADDGEKPRHKIYLSAFWIYKTEVTNAQYQKCVEAGACTPPHDMKYYDDPAYSDHPVVYVDWHQAKAYSEWAGGRLPTEAEWEKAARGTDGRIYPWGNEFDKAKCNVYESGIRNTTSVGKYSPQGDGPYGVADMAGNVWEWTSSLYRGYPYDPDDGREAPEADGARVLRGGSWDNYERFARCASRGGYVPDYFYNNLGFRVLALPKEEEGSD